MHSLRPSFFLFCSTLRFTLNICISFSSASPLLFDRPVPFLSLLLFCRHPAPFMSGYLMDALLPQARLNALRTLAKAYAPTPLPVLHVHRALGFDGGACLCVCWRVRSSVWVCTRVDIFVVQLLCIKLREVTFDEGKWKRNRDCEVSLDHRHEKSGVSHFQFLVIHLYMCRR